MLLQNCEAVSRKIVGEESFTIADPHTVRCKQIKEKGRRNHLIFQWNVSCISRKKLFVEGE